MPHTSSPSPVLAASTPTLDAPGFSDPELDASLARLDWCDIHAFCQARFASTPLPPALCLAGKQGELRLTVYTSGQARILERGQGIMSRSLEGARQIWLHWERGQAQRLELLIPCLSRDAPPVAWGYPEAPHLCVQGHLCRVLTHAPETGEDLWDDYDFETTFNRMHVVR